MTTLARRDLGAGHASASTIVRDVRLLLRNGRSEGDGTLVPGRKGRCSVRVTRSCLPRALALLKTLVGAVRHVGYDLAFEDGLLKVMVADDSMDLLIRERVVRRPHVADPEEMWPRKFDLKPTGELCVSVEGRWISTRTLWNESAGRPSEQLVPRVLAGILRAAASMRDASLAQERRMAEYREARRLEEEREAHRAAERQRIEHLDGLVEGWDRSRRIHAFLDAVERGSCSFTQPRSWPGNPGGWFEWARRYADHLDPLKTPHDESA